MAKGHFELLRDLFRPRLVKVGAGLTSGLFIYDALSNQFDLTKLGKLLGMSGNLLPWWGWLLILQAILVYALFEYVRRISPSSPPEYDDEEIREELEDVRETIRQLGLSVSGALQIAEEAKSNAEELAELKKGIAKFEVVYAATRSLDGDALTARFENVYLALEAIHDRHRLNVIEGQLNLNVASLLVQDDTPPFDDFSWLAWEGNEQKWRANVELWCERAAKYMPDVRKRVFETPERSYRVGDWPSDELFGDFNRAHAYKTFLIIWRNLGDLRGDVGARVHNAAFERQALEMRRDRDR